MTSQSTPPPSPEPIDEAGFFQKCKRSLLGVPLALDTMACYFAMLDERTPLWVKTCVASGITYLVLPLDAVPDFLPIGLADDAAVLAATVKLVAAHLLPEHYDQSRDWFKK